MIDKMIPTRCQPLIRVTCYASVAVGLVVD